MKTLTCVLVVLLVAGCGALRPKPAPVNENCDAICRVPCDTTVPLWKPVDANRSDAWTSYPEQVTLPLAKKLDTCEVARQACVQCLDRLKQAGVTR